MSFCYISALQLSENPPRKKISIHSQHADVVKGDFFRLRKYLFYFNITMCLCYRHYDI